MRVSAPSPSQPAVPPRTPERILHRLEWRVIRRLDGQLQGDYRTLFFGDGLDFAGLREYQAEDDVRHIDWNATARMDTPYVREHIDDRELTAWMLLDRSPSMSFGLEERPKGLVLTELVATLSRLMTRRGNRVGAMLYTDRVERTIPPGGGRNQVLHLTQELLRQPSATRQTTALSGLMMSALNTIKRRSLIFLISDFISEPGWEGPLALLARRHDIVAIRLWDQREVELPDAGIIVMEDAETGEQLLVDTGDPALRRRFAELAEARELRLQSSFVRAGIDLFDVGTDEDLVVALVRMAERRKKKRR